MTESGLEADITQPNNVVLVERTNGTVTELPGLMYLHVYKLVSFDRLKVFAAMAVKQS